MDGDNLVRMANRIGDFFAAQPDRAEALEGIAQHVGRFWEPRMRRAMFARLDGGSADGLQPMVAEALQTYRHTLLPVPPQGESEA